MNIPKALKVKNRLVGNVTKLQEIVKRENSRRSDNTSTVNVEHTIASLTAERVKLTSLKAAIAVASAPISLKLSQLSETKTYINWLTALPTRDGIEKVAFGAKEVEDYEWKAYYTRAKLDEELNLEQQKVNALQDEVDEYNTKTQVSWVE